MTNSASHHWDQETMLVVWLAAGVSLFSFLFFLRHGDVLLYGDAVAHMGIARRVFDSRTPGLLQLGTVWLPLPHLLMIPFLLSDWMWQTGAGGSIPSLIAFVFGAVGIFRLVRGTLRPSAGEPGPAARTAAWGAAVIYVANPNLIYLQATAMTEALYLALFIWAVVYFSEFVQGEDALTKCSLCLAGACLTRYDGWFLAGVLAVAALAVTWRRAGAAALLRRRFVVFALLLAAVPVLWVVYNAAVYRNPLEFANGPYSAKAIEQKTAVPGFPPHPGTQNLHVAAAYFLKAGELNLAAGNWGRLWLLLAVVGIASVVFAKHIGLAGENGRTSLWPLLLLWTPLPFYMLSIAYGGVPVFLPRWWPDSIYNARYGLQLLPAFALFTALAVYFAAGFARNRRVRAAFAGVMLALVAASYAWTWGNRAICFQEAWINSRTRLALEAELGAYLRAMPLNSTILIYLGDHVGALQRAGIPLRRTINEGNHRVWKQPVDPGGLWERALADPAGYADYVIAVDHDPVAEKVNHSELRTLAVIHVSGQRTAVIYRTAKER
jgi:hypothetical protein